MFKTETTVIGHTNHSSLHDNFLGAVGLLVVAAIASALIGSFFGVISLGALIGILWMRAQWARIVTLVITGYVGLVGLLISLFGRGERSFAGFIAALMAAGIFWLLVRPGMSQYFSSQVVAADVPTPERLSVPISDGYLHKVPSPAASTPTRGGSIHEQWARLQQQLRREQALEEGEAAATESHDKGIRDSFPWLTLIFSIAVFAYAASVGGDLAKASMLLVIPGFMAAMLRWIPPRGFLLGVLVLSDCLIVRPDWAIVAPEIHILLRHYGSMAFAGATLLVYATALCASGFAGDCENHA